MSLDSRNPTTEPCIGPSHTVIFVFDKPVTAGEASVTSGKGTAPAATFNGSELRVPLNEVANQQFLTVSVTNVAGVDGSTGGSGSVRLGFLLGDAPGIRALIAAVVADIAAGQRRH